MTSPITAHKLEKKHFNGVLSNTTIKNLLKEAGLKPLFSAPGPGRGFTDWYEEKEAVKIIKEHLAKKSQKIEPAFVPPLPKDGVSLTDVRNRLDLLDTTLLDLVVAGGKLEKQVEILLEQNKVLHKELETVAELQKKLYEEWRTEVQK